MAGDQHIGDSPLCLESHPLFSQPNIVQVWALLLVMKQCESEVVGKPPPCFALWASEQKEDRFFLFDSPNPWLFFDSNFEYIMCVE